MVYLTLEVLGDHRLAWHTHWEEGDAFDLTARFSEADVAEANPDYLRSQAGSANAWLRRAVRTVASHQVEQTPLAAGLPALCTALSEAKRLGAEVLIAAPAARPQIPISHPGVALAFREKITESVKSAIYLWNGGPDRLTDVAVQCTRKTMSFMFGKNVEPIVHIPMVGPGEWATVGIYDPLADFETLLSYEVSARIDGGRSFGGRAIIPDRPFSNDLFPVSEPSGS